MSAIEALRAALAAGPTPGPWHVYEKTDRYPGIEANQARQSIVVFGNEGDESGVRGKTQAEALANAQLIAAACNAAPELLAEVDRLTAERDALRVPQGWQIEQLPSGEIAMYAKGIGSCVVAPAETQPRIIPTEMLYALAQALIAPQPEGDAK